MTIKSMYLDGFSINGDKCFVRCDLVDVLVSVEISIVQKGDVVVLLVNGIEKFSVNSSDKDAVKKLDNLKDCTLMSSINSSMYFFYEASVLSLL